MIPRILSSDPGRFKSHYGVTLLEVHYPKIHIKGAAEFALQKYRDMEKYISEVHKRKAVTHVAVEQNNVGVHVIEDLEDEYNLPVLSITTGNRIKDKKKIMYGVVMDKIEHGYWLKKAFEDELILYPSTDTDGIRQLRKQVQSITKKITPAGNETLGAEGTQQDDMWMSLMIGTHVIRHIYFRRSLGQMHGANRDSQFSDLTPKEKVESAMIQKMKNLGLPIKHIDIFMPNDSH